jgi:hypothetical protein
MDVQISDKGQGKRTFVIHMAKTFFSVATQGAEKMGLFTRSRTFLLFYDPIDK